MRIAGKGRVDRNKPVNFTFDGVSYQGFAGDTLASALLANGVTLMGRSFKYHRPRGVLTAGSEEPNALVTVADDPNLRATTVEIYNGLDVRSQNAWPSLKRDVMAVNDLISPFWARASTTRPSCGPRRSGKRSMSRSSAVRQALGR